MTPHRSPRQADLIDHDFGAAAASLDARRVRNHRVILKPS